MRLMMRWVRYYFADDDAWLHYEVDADGEVTRQVDLLGPDRAPATAAAWSELADCATVSEVQQYEAKYGSIASEPLRPEDLAQCEPMTKDEFNELWRDSRQELG
jgi:hypothetical protein